MQIKGEILISLSKHALTRIYAVVSYHFAKLGIPYSTYFTILGILGYNLPEEKKGFLLNNTIY
jgi:hypothetical protein